MSGLTLYAMSAEWRAALDHMADLDVDAQTVVDTLESLPGDLKAKAANVARVYLTMDILAAGQEAASKAMKARAKATQTRADQLRQYLADNIQRAGITKIEDDEVCISWRKSSAVVIDGVDLLPDEFMRQPETPPPEPDKTLIAAAFKAGRVVPGAHLEHRQSLQIR